MEIIANKVCPVEKANSLNSRFRRWLQNPEKILAGYVEEGMSVLDFGCGPGFFSIELAKMVGPSGRIISVDLQDGMLGKISAAIKGTNMEDVIELHQCTSNDISVRQSVDFILAFYVIHELPDQEKSISQLCEVLRPGGKLFLAEPGLFHVTKQEFDNTVNLLINQGLQVIARPRLMLSKAIVFKK